MQLMRLYLLLFPLQWSRGIDHINNYGAVSIIGKLPCSIMTWRMRGEDSALPSLHLNEVLCDVNIYLVLHLLSNWLSHSTLQFPGSREEAGLHTQQGWILWTLVCILPFFTHVLFFTQYIDVLFLGKLELVDSKGCYSLFDLVTLYSMKKETIFIIQFVFPPKWVEWNFYSALALY